MTYTLFNEEPVESLKESTERIALTCSQKAMGPDAFGGYFKIFGPKQGLEKAIESCVRNEIGKVKGITLLDKFISKSKLDFGFKRGKLTYGVQVKTSEKYSKILGLSRIDEHYDENLSKESISLIGKETYRRIAEEECLLKGMDVCLLLCIYPRLGKMYWRRLAHMENGKLVMDSTDDTAYTYKPKSTLLKINQELFPLIGTRTFTPLSYEAPVFPKILRKIDITEYINLSNEILIEFQKFNDYILGDEWGDKGKA